MVLWSCPVLAYGPKHGQKHGAERKRIPKTEDSLAERSGFELSVPLVERERADFCDFPFSAKETDRSQRRTAVLEKKLLGLQVERMDSHKAECIGSRA